MSEEVLKKEKPEENVKDEENVKNEENKAKQKSPLRDPEEVVRKIAKGRITLFTPIRADGRDVTELEYDFTALTGRDYVEAMDRDPKAAMSYYTTQTQGFHLFCKAAAKATAGVDEEDVARGISAVDTGKAVQLAMTFINSSLRAANRRISNE